MRIEPVNVDHAIISAEFRVQFDQTLARNVLESIRLNHHIWRDELPAFRDGNIYSVNLDHKTPPNVIPEPTFEFAYLKPDGSHSWSMTVSGNEILIQCTRYTRWEKVYTQAFNLLVEALTVIAKEQDVNIPVVSLNMIDHFLGFKDGKAYCVYDIFKRDTFIPAMIEDVGDVWHSHTGWFSHSKNHHILNQCNVDVVRRGNDINLQRNADSGTTITHIQNTSFAQPISAKDPRSLENFFEGMHIANKEMLTRLLQDSLLELIGLKNVS